MLAAQPPFGSCPDSLSGLLFSYCPHLKNILRHNPSWEAPAPRLWTLTLWTLRFLLLSALSQFGGYASEHRGDQAQTELSPFFVTCHVRLPHAHWHQLPKAEEPARQISPAQGKGPVVIMRIFVFTTYFPPYTSRCSHSPSRSVTDCWNASHVRFQ